MKNKKYPNGYWPKLEYWYTLLDQAIKSRDSEAVRVCMDKLDYFLKREGRTHI